MVKLLEILQFVILSGFIAAGNITGFDTQIMRLTAVITFFLMMPILFYIGKKSGLSALNKGISVFILMNIFIFWVFPESLGPVLFYSPTGILYAVFFAMVFFPAIIKNIYFTEFFAKKTTPQEFWETDQFKTINRNMSLQWAGLFAVSSFITYLPYLLPVKQSIFTGYLFQIILPMVIMAGIGITLNKKYPAYYMKKAGIDPGIIIAETSAPAFTENKINNQYNEEIMNKIKIIALNGSPHGGVGNTSQMIQMIGSGVAAQGIDYELEEIFLSDMNIEYCVGCAFCLENSRCWKKDDHAEILDKLFKADAIILGSPVYFRHVTGQMKTFIDRSLSLGHKPRTATKPGIAVSVSAGMADAATGRYLEGLLRVYGAFSIGALTSIAVNPGGFLGKEEVKARARDLGSDLVRAIRENRKYPVNDETYYFYLFMRDLVTREKEFMKGDYKYWEENGILDRFESYVKQEYTEPAFDSSTRKEWLKGLMQKAKNTTKEKKQYTIQGNTQAVNSGPESAASCYELLKIMPKGFIQESANGLKAVYQFHISGDEKFTAHLSIENGACTFNEGSHSKPDVEINSPADVWLAISKGELNGQAAFMNGRYKVTGDLSLLMKLDSLFGNA